MNSQLIHVNKKITADMIRREQVNGADSIIIRSATLPDNVVMNGGLYPAEEIESSYKGLERKLAPLGHPMMDGKFISAADPHAVHNYDVGAYVANVSREGGRVFHDTVINVDVAGRSDKGRKLLDAINAMEETGEPIHTSTGIYLKRQELDAPMTNAAGHEYNWIATNMQFDHNAILINEEGAATPQQGVGLAVNSAGEELELMTVNEDEEYLTEDQNEEEQLDMLREALNDAVNSKEVGAKGVYVLYNGIYSDKVIYEARFEDDTEKTFSREYRFMDGEIILSDERTEVERKTLWKVVKDSMSFIKNMAFAPRIDAAYNEDVITTNSHEDLEMTKEEMQALLKEQAETMQANFDEKLAPLTQKIESLEANAKANEEAERAPLAEKAKSKGLEQTDIDAMSTNALKVMFGAPADKSATYATGGEPVTNKEKDEWEGYDLNANMEAK